MLSIWFFFLAMKMGSGASEFPRRILNFWFDGLWHDGANMNVSTIPKNTLAKWFSSTPEIDAEVMGFEKEMKDALQDAEYIKKERSTPEGLLANILLLDQFPRNGYRKNRLMFSGDALAVTLAEEMVDSGFDARLPNVYMKIFAYLPFEHSENLEHQKRSCKLFEKLASENPDVEFVKKAYEYAKEHFKMIERFGRFPYRNEILDRPSTPEEQEWALAGGKGFL